MARSSIQLEHLGFAPELFEARPRKAIAFAASWGFKIRKQNLRFVLQQEPPV
jgi:hypothetical protein